MVSSGLSGITTAGCFTKQHKPERMTQTHADDLVATMDNRLQPIRWIGQRRISERGDDVTYVHMAFDQHAVIFAEDTPSERRILASVARLHFSVSLSPQSTPKSLNYLVTKVAI